MKFGDAVKFRDIPTNDYFYGGGYIFQSVRSGDVYKQRFAPNVCVMKVYRVLAVY